MSQTNCECCPQPAVPLEIPLTDARFHCGSVIVDAANLGWRTRVTQDLDVYINGNFADSGDGLTPETAVKSFDEAIDVIGRHDGCNRYAVNVHFANLAGGAMYPDVTIYGGNHSTFTRVNIDGESPTETWVGRVWARDQACVYIMNIQASNFLSLAANMFCTGTIYIRSVVSGLNAFEANSNGFLETRDSHIYVQKNSYNAIFAANVNGVLNCENSTVSLNAITSTGALLVANHASSVRIIGTQISGNNTGKKYNASNLSCITSTTSLSTYPGTIAGTTSNGGVTTPA